MQNICVKILGNGIRLTCVTTDQWKTSLMSACFALPLGNEGRSLSALLPYVLRSNCSVYPGRQEVAIRLDELYGARLEPYVTKRGEMQLVGVMADAIDERYALGETGSLVEQTANLLSNILLLPENPFQNRVLRRESNVLQARIAALSNNKRTWVVRRMYQLMCAKENYRLVEYGDVEDLAQANPDALRQQYEQILKQAPLELFYCGSMQPERVEDIFRRQFEKVAGRERIIHPQTEIIANHTDLWEITEEENVKQGKLAIGFRLGVTVNDPLYPASVLFNACYGGMTGSRLFRTVREQKSLCYYASSQTDKIKGVMAVSSGIENENKDKASEEILRQFELIQSGDLSQDEVEAARRSVLATLYSIADSPYALENYYQTQAAAGINLPLETLMERIRYVTTEQVTQAALCAEPELAYFLKGAAQ